MDLFPTCIRLAGAKIPTDRRMDGRDLAPVLFKNNPGRPALMHYYFGTELWAVRKGPWKLHFKTTDPSTVTVWGAWNIKEHNPPLLFNVEHDPGEQYSKADSHPKIVEELIALAEAHRKSVKPGDPQR